VTISREVAFVKGHGTGNDFIVIPDPDGRLSLSDAQVRWLCDRHVGLGADGVLRVVRSASLKAEDVAPAGAAEAEFFMDYRNADGSRAEMCGNGIRVFARYLHASGLVTDADVVIGTRGGLRRTTVEPDGSISVGMGIATGLDVEPVVAVRDARWPAVPVVVPNPHAVVFVGSLDDAGDLRSAPDVTPGDAYPDGVNVEFVVTRGMRHVAMRVHERGVGETQSCGTGACAVAWAARRRETATVVGSSVYRVDVPGGTVHVTESEDGDLVLRGPAELVARGTVLLPDDPDQSDVSGSAGVSA
jgi:diaminopimelate epimerase